MRRKNRVIDYETYRREKMPEYRRKLALLRSRQGKRTARQRPRDPDEEALLLRMCQDRRDYLLASGRLERVGPRHWRWHSLEDDR